MPPARSVNSLATGTGTSHHDLSTLRKNVIGKYLLSKSEASLHQPGAPAAAAIPPKINTTLPGKPQNNSSVTPRDAVFSPAFSPASRFDSLPDGQSKGKYRATPLQWDIYTRLCPSKDEKESPTYAQYQGPPFTITQAYRIHKHPLNMLDLKNVINKIFSLYSVIRTKFYRNDRILDADVEGILDSRLWTELPLESYIESVDAATIPELTQGGDDNLTIANYATQWSQTIGVNVPVSILHIHLPPDQDTSEPNGHYPSHVLVFAASQAVLDSTSLTWISRETILLYRECYRLRKFGHGDAEVISKIDRHETIESEQFVEFANECKRNKKDMQFWRDQCIEVKQDTVERREKDDLEGQLKRLSKEREILKSSLTSLVKRKAELETELDVLSRQRKQIDRSENGEGAISTYVDAATGEMVLITQEAKSALIKAVLGEDASSDNVMSLLDKHEVPKEAQRKIDATSLTMETFAAITDAAVEDLGLLSRDRRKIVALAEYVRNRIKDCLHEQSKVKFALERKIAKTKRDLESATEGVKTTTNQLESNDDLTIRLNYILKPPYIETRISPISLEKHYDAVLNDSPGAKVRNDPISRWGFVPLVIDAETIENLRRFRANWTISVKNRRKQRRAAINTLADDGSVSSDNESLLDSNDEEEEDDGFTSVPSSPVKANAPAGSNASQLLGSSAIADSTDSIDAVTGQPKRMKIKSIDVVCLAAYSVLLKHISGNDKFLVGITQSFRRYGLFVGPLTDTMPIRVDLSKHGMTFDSLFASLFKVFDNTKRHGVACTQHQIATTFNVSGDLNARFEFFDLKDTKAWTKKGLTISDLLQKCEPCFHVGGLSTERIWADDQTDQYDLKLVLAETPAGLEGGMRFLRSRFDESKVEKWMAKLQSTLESIDYGPRKIPISSLISR
eukprot:jgi/Hompol1/6152/HPOL_002607-RA